MILLCFESQAQGDCISEFGAVYGSENASERGKCVVKTAAGDGFYAIGMVEDSALIMKLNLTGEILWSRTFDIVPGETDHVAAAILDSEGNLAVTGLAGDNGTGGNVFVFRYNPNTDQVLWANEYVNYTMRSYAFAIVQKGSGGNYVIANVAQETNNTPNDDELIEINKNNGNPNPAFSKNYNLGGSDNTSELIYSGGSLYGTGRYTDGQPNNLMRHSLMKVNPGDGSYAWIKLGHIPVNQNARLYGKDLVIEADQIYSLYYGDPAGTSTTNTKLYIQKTDLNGNLEWLKQYELPGSNDVGHQLIRSGNGFVILAMKNAAPSEIIIFKINDSGAVLWGKTFQFTSIISSVVIDRGNSQIIDIGSNLVITATANNPGGTTDMLIIRTDLNGELDMPCAESIPLTVTVNTISNPSFYAVNPTVFDVTPEVNSLSPEPVETIMMPREECIITDTIYADVEATICDGESFEGYSVEGIYIDAFVTSQGCDSIRTLDLSISNPLPTFEEVEICLGDSYAGYTESGTYTNTFQTALGCDSVHTLQLEVVPIEVNLDIEICEGQQYAGYDEPGFYVDTLQGDECDTIRYLDLIIYPGDETFLEVSICDGEEYEGYSSTGLYIDVFSNTEGCDSFRTLELTVQSEIHTDEEVSICLGESYDGYSSTGIYTNTFQSEFGCDSIHTLDLTVEPLVENLFIEICEGEQYDSYSTSGFYVDTLQGPPGDCDTIRYLELEVSGVDETFLSIAICSGDTYEGYTTNGVYIDEFLNSAGCDSFRTLNLVVVDELQTDESIVICPGESYQGYMNSGMYVDTFTSIAGCDSIRNLELLVSLPGKTVNVSLCSGGYFENYTQAGNYLDTLDGISGSCDTIRHLTITLLPTLETFINANICEGQSFLGYTSTGIHIDTFQTLESCDSLRILNLTVSDIIVVDQSIVICPGNAYEGYSDSGIYQDTFVSVFSCDSVRVLDLQIEMPEISLDKTICAGEIFESYTQSGIYEDTLQGNSNVCDTIRHLTLTVLPPDEIDLIHTICSGQTFLGYNETGIYRDTFQNIEGCDSIRILNLTVTNQIIMDQSIQLCLGDSYNGISLPGFYSDTLQATFGCDSIINLEVEVIPVEIHVDKEICDGSSFENYSSPGSYIDTLQGVAAPCDTIRHLTLSIMPVLEMAEDIVICPGANYYGYTKAGIYRDTFINALGCDSIHMITISLEDQPITHIESSVCEDIFYGYSKPGTYVDTLVSSAGCDSVRTLVLTGGSTYIPNVFSPNHDGINDQFIIAQFPDNSLDLNYFGIFDRFGDMTYQTSQWPIEWDGTDIHQKPYQQGVFAYILIYTCGGTQIVEYGDITLLK